MFRSLLIPKKKQLSKHCRDFARSYKGENATEFDVLIDVSEDDIKKWLKDMIDRGLGEKSRVKDVSKLHRFFVFLTESPKYNLKYNPVSRISKQIPKPSKHTQRPIKSLEEISKMVRSIFHVRDRTIIILLGKTGIRAGELSALDVDDETLRALKVYLAIRQPCVTKALFISDRGNRMFLADIDKIVKNWAIKTGTCKDSNRTDEKITPHFFRAWITYQLQIKGCNPIVIDAIRGDKASNMRMFYANQVLPFEEIQREYERTVPKFGI